jgi:hypothetical protein
MLGRSFIAARAVLVAITTCASQPVWADCTASSRFSFAFSSMTAQTLNYANSYNLTASNALGQTQVVTLSFVTNGLSSTTVGGNAMPAVSTLINDGGTTNNNLIVGGTFTGRTTDVSAATRVVVARFTAPTMVRDFTIQINDIDFSADQYRDWAQVNASNGAVSYNAALSTPHGTNNSVSGPHATANSSMLVGATSTPLSLSVKQAGGTGLSGSNANTGTLTAIIAQPITQAEVRYGNYPLTAGETVTGQQAIGIQGFSFCPMPVVSVSKTATPFETAAVANNRFNIPGADMIYTLTVTNSTASPIDLDSLILTDPLPNTLTFGNVDYDGGGPLTGNFEFIPGTSGLAVGPSDLSYSNNGGTTYSYSPAPGYDTAVQALRINPKGQMAGNSSFTVRFRTQIK